MAAPGLSVRSPRTITQRRGAQIPQNLADPVRLPSLYKVLSQAYRQQEEQSGEVGHHAGAITIAGSTGDASCATFIPLDVKGGLSRVVAAVGACQRAECSHNDHLECNAESVRIGAGGTHHADCLTYSPA